MSRPDRRPVVFVEDVSFAYEARGPEVLRDFSWTFPQGAVTALLGPNGSGKTTLLNLILGWLAPRRGRIHINGRTHQEVPRREMSRQVGFVPPNESPEFDLQLEEYVLLGRAPYISLLGQPAESDRQAAAAAVESSGLGALGRRPVNALSSGERQLASLARALAQDPDIFLLDEPLSHLDIANSRRVFGLMDALRRGGKTIIFTTHDPNCASAVADEAVLLRSGRRLAAGPAAEVLTPAHLSETYGVDVPVTVIDGRPVVLPRI